MQAPGGHVQELAANVFGQVILKWLTKSTTYKRSMHLGYCSATRAWCGGHLWWREMELKNHPNPEFIDF